MRPLGVPNCDFAALQALAGTDVTPPVSDFTGTNNCLLTPTFHQSWDVVSEVDLAGNHRHDPLGCGRPSADPLFDRTGHLLRRPRHAAEFPRVLSHL